MLFGNVCLNCVYSTFFAVLLFPDSIDYLDFGITNGFNFAAGCVVLVASSDGNDKFITNRKHRFDRFLDWIVQLYAVTNKRKTAYFHQFSQKSNKKTANKYALPP